MTAHKFRSNFGEWENAPVVQEQVMAYMDSIGAPMLLREVYRPLGLPKEIANRVLCRLHAKGVLKRWKIPVAAHRPAKRGQKATGEVTRRCFLYRFADKFGQ